jgi:hypothetical protein
LRAGFRCYLLGFLDLLAVGRFHVSPFSPALVS